MDVSLVSLVSPEPSAPAKPDVPASDVPQFDQLLAADAKSARASAVLAARPTVNPRVASPNAHGHGHAHPRAERRPANTPAQPPAADQTHASDDTSPAPTNTAQATGAKPDDTRPDTNKNKDDRADGAASDPSADASQAAKDQDAQQADDAAQAAADGQDNQDKEKSGDLTAAAVAPVPAAATPEATPGESAPQAAAAVEPATGTAPPQPAGLTSDSGAALGAPPSAPPPQAAAGATDGAPADSTNVTMPAAAAEHASDQARLALLTEASARASAALAEAATKGTADAPHDAAPANPGKTAAEVLAQINRANVTVKIAAASQDAGQSALGDAARNPGNANGAAAPPTTGGTNPLSGDTLLLSQLGEAAHHLAEAAPAAAASQAAPAASDANALVAHGTAATEGASQPAPANAPAPAARPAPLLQPLIDQVLPHLSQATNGTNGGRFTINLRPPELGRVQVDLKISQDGHVTAMIVADRHDALALLQRDSHLLEQALSDAGLSTNSGDLQFSLSGDSHGTNFDEPNTSSFNAGAAAAAAALDEPEPPTVVRQIGGLSLVDLHV